MAMPGGIVHGIHQLMDTTAVPGDMTPGMVIIIRIEVHSIMDTIQDCTVHRVTIIKGNKKNMIIPGEWPGELMLSRTRTGSHRIAEHR